MERLELSRFYSLEPKSSAATNYATSPLFGSSTWARTRDNLINSQVLYQLSYQGIILLAFFRSKCHWCCLCINHGSFKSVAIVLIFKL